MTGGSYHGGLAGKMGPGLHLVCSQAKNKRSELGDRTGFKKPKSLLRATPSLTSHLTPPLQMLGAEPWGAQCPGHGLWRSHVPFQPGGAGLGTVGPAQTEGSGEGARHPGLQGHRHCAGPHRAAGHHLGFGLLLLWHLPAAPALPLHHLQLSLRWVLWAAWRKPWGVVHIW